MNPSKFTRIPIETQELPQQVTKTHFLIHPANIKIQTQTNNLFAGSSDLLKKLPDHERGPRADKTGSIIRYTLVGSVQNFMRENERRQQLKQSIQQKQKVQLKQSFIPVPDDQASARSISNSFQKLTDAQQSSTNLSKPGKKRRMDYQEIPLTQDEVEDEIRVISQRLDENKAKNLRMVNKLKSELNKGDSLKVDNYERALRNFNQTQEKWDSKKKSTGLSIKSPGQTMDDRIEQYRVREEMRQLLDNLTPPEIKYGNNFWKLGLRQPESSLQQPYPYKCMEDEKARVEYKPPVMEIVRKPSSTQSQFRPFTSLSTRKYLDKKLSENEDLIKKLIPTSPEQLEQLQVVGESKLKQEAQSLLVPCQPSTHSLIRVNTVDNLTRFVKRIPKKPEAQGNNDEVLLQNYDKKNVLIRGQFGSTMGFF